MTHASLADFTNSAAAAAEPFFVAAAVPKLGGVDPLGLRQINFDLMDQVFPGINNVARHIRPFVVVTWAWRRAQKLAEERGIKKISVNELRDFVDRIEVIYAWSQFLRNSEADLPGRQVLAPLIKSARWNFGGAAWQKRCNERRYSTAFTAPITYGPSLKTLGWVAAHRNHPEVLIPTPASHPALDAFEALIAGRLAHPAFCKFGSVEVSAEEVKNWSEQWALDHVTDMEKLVMRELLLGSGAPLSRKRGCELMLTAAAHAKSTEIATVRRTMAGPPSNFVPPGELDNTFEAWRRIQVRQLFRLSLEALLFWITFQIEKGPRSTNALVDAFFKEAGGAQDSITGDWLKSRSVAGKGPIELMDSIESALDESTPTDLASTIADALSFCIVEAPESGQLFERSDRLPLFRARREAEAWTGAPTETFIRHVIESWVLAQHVYWSVGRGLGDARAGGKTILRLKIVLEESGWTLAPGATRRLPPIPTPDRLQTAISLAGECGLLPSVA